MKVTGYLRILILAALASAFASCVEEDYAVGEKDRLDCQGLFFPQKQAKHYEISPSSKMELTLTAERAVYDEEAYVPFELTCSHEGIFEFEDEEFIYFDEDAPVASIRISISDEFELGETYSCTMKVTDPQFVSMYGLSSNVLTFSVSVVDWVRVKSPDKTEDMATWRDDFFSSLAIMLGADPKKPYLEKEVEVYERSDKPGYFRVDNIYTPEYISQIHAGDESMKDELKDFCPAESIIIDATNPDKVFINAQFAFFNPYEFTTDAAGLDVYICSDVEEVFISGYSNQYGTYKDGVIEFPAKSLVIYMPAITSFYGNTSGKTRLVLPGYTGYDYGISVEVSPSEEGKMPVTFVLDADVAKVRYQIFSGHLSDVEMVSRLEETKKSDKEIVPGEDGTCTFDFEAQDSGLYTIIACSYDAQGNFRKYDYAHFGYDTADDPREVDIHLGLIVSDKHAGAGHTSENSMEYYVYGNDITDAKVAIYKKVHYEDFRETIDMEFERFLPSLDDFQLDSLNNAGYTGLITGLAAGTEYILVVYADNGYHSGFYTAGASTAGVFDLMDSDFSVYDMPSRLQPDKEDKTPYLKDWHVWSFNPHKTGKWGRNKAAEVTIEDAKDMMYDEDGKETRDPAKAVLTVDYMTLSGMHPTLAKMGLKDEIDLEFHEGFIYTLMTPMDPMTYEGSTVYPTNAYLYFDGGALYPNLENGAMIGGFLTEEKDVIAFVSNPSSAAGQYGFNYVAMQLCWYESDDYANSNAYLFEEDSHAYPLLVSPDSEYASYNPDKKASERLRTSCDMIYAELQKGQSNYVETARGYIMSTIDKIKDAPYNYMNNAEKMHVNIVREDRPAGLQYLERELR